MSQIEREFAADNIKKLIDTAAKEAALKRINISEIQSLIDDEVERIVRTRVDELKNQIELLETENRKALENLSVLSDLNLAVINAQYEIQSLKKLKEISECEDTKIASIAFRLMHRLIDEIERDFDRLNSPIFRFMDGFWPEYFGLETVQNWTVSDYLENYSKIESDQRIVYVNQYLIDPKNDEISKYKFALGILNKEELPRVVYTICAFVNSKAQIDKDYLFESEEYVKWLGSKM